MALELPAPQDLDTLAEKRLAGHTIKSRNIVQFMPDELEFFASRELCRLATKLRAFGGSKTFASEDHTISQASANESVEELWEEYDALGQAEATEQLEDNPYALVGFAIERFCVALDSNNVSRRNETLLDAITIAEHEGLDRFATTLRLIQDDIMRGQRKAGPSRSI